MRVAENTAHMGLEMDPLTRRSFVKSLGLAAGLSSIPTAASGQSESRVPDVPMPGVAIDSRGLRFRQVHLDFHTSPLITDVGADFDASEFVQTLKDAHVNSVNIFAKCHHGMAYYPSKVGPVHPGLKFDLLGKMIESCHKADILTPVYITVMWDQYSAETRRLASSRRAWDSGWRHAFRGGLDTVVYQYAVSRLCVRAGRRSRKELRGGRILV